MTRTPLVAWILLAAALPASGQIFDCFQDAQIQAFRQALAKTKDDNAPLYRTLASKPIESPRGAADSRRCNIVQWCTVQRAKVKWAPAQSEGGVSLLGVEWAPEPPCPAPWPTACEDGACRLTSPPLESGAKGAPFERDPSGLARVGGQPPAYSPKSAGTGGDFPGIAFNWDGKAYKMQFKTRYVFRLTAGAQGANSYADTGATIGPALYSALCADASLQCASMEKAGCGPLGLAPKGKAFTDVRGQPWKNAPKGGDCRSDSQP